MADSGFRLQYAECKPLLRERLAERAPGRIQLLTGPRQVGKTTLLLELAAKLGPTAIYAAVDGPEAALPGFWERLWARAERTAAEKGRSYVLLDEAHLMPEWASRLKGAWDRAHRRRIPVQVVATGSSALRIASGWREGLLGRFERLTLAHWSARGLVDAFHTSESEAVEAVVRLGAYPGAFQYRRDDRRWSAYVRDAILEPAVGRDILALSAIRKPGLLRQVFGVCALSPAKIVSLQKIQGQLQDPGALETISYYLSLLQDAYLVAALPKFPATSPRRRAAPPKLVALSNSVLAAMDPQGPVDPSTDPAKFGSWVENACLAHALNAGQAVSYWREEPFEVDGVVEGTWGKWAVEVKSGTIQPADLRGLVEFQRRHPTHRPVVLCDEEETGAVERLGLEALPWREYLLRGLGATG